MAIASGPPGCSLPHVCSTQVNGTAALAGGAGGETSYGESHIQPRTSPAPCIPATGPSAAPRRSQERYNLFNSRSTSPSGQGAGVALAEDTAGANLQQPWRRDGPPPLLRGLYPRRDALSAGSPAHRGYARARAAPMLCSHLDARGTAATACPSAARARASLRVCESSAYCRALLFTLRISLRTLSPSYVTGSHHSACPAVACCGEPHARCVQGLTFRVGARLCDCVWVF